MSPGRRLALVVVLAAFACASAAVFVVSPEQATWSGRQLAGNLDVIAFYLVQHTRYTVIAVLLGTVLSLPLAYLALRVPRTYPVVLSVTNVLYAIPSLAMFVLLGELLNRRVGDTPVVVAMAIYSLIILVRNLVEAVRSVPETVVRAADGMGYRPLARFFKVELPLALPGIVAGLRLATVSTVSLISVGALLGRGGLGRLFDDGRRRGIAVEIWSGVITIVLLALVLDALIVFVGWVATPWRTGPRRGGRGVLRRAAA